MAVPCACDWKQCLLFHYSTIPSASSSSFSLLKLLRGYHNWRHAQIKIVVDILYPVVFPLWLVLNMPRSQQKTFRNILCKSQIYDYPYMMKTCCPGFMPTILELDPRQALPVKGWLSSALVCTKPMRHFWGAIRSKNGGWTTQIICSKPPWLDDDWWWMSPFRNYRTRSQYHWISIDIRWVYRGSARLNQTKDRGLHSATGQPCHVSTRGVPHSLRYSQLEAPERRGKLKAVPRKFDGINGYSGENLRGTLWQWLT